MLSNLDVESRTWYGNLDRALLDMPLSIYPGKSEKQPDKCVLQSVHNYYLKFVLEQQGWTLEPFADGVGTSQRRADFSAGTARKKIVAEVELGNKARIDSALIKFQSAYHAGILKLAILVVATNRLAAMTDSGLASYEPAVEYLNSLPDAMVPFPLIVIGLEPDESTHVLDWSRTKVGGARYLSGNSDKSVLAHVVSELCAGVVFEEIQRPVTMLEQVEAKDLAKRLNAPTVTRTDAVEGSASRILDKLRTSWAGLVSDVDAWLRPVQPAFAINGMRLAW